jgi:hypothetical protein
MIGVPAEGTAGKHNGGGEGGDKNRRKTMARGFSADAVKVQAIGMICISAGGRFQPLDGGKKSYPLFCRNRIRSSGPPERFAYGWSVTSRPLNRPECRGQFTFSARASLEACRLSAERK